MQIPYPSATFFCLRLLPIALTAIALVGSVHGQSTWDGAPDGGGASADGNWQTATNWDGDTAPTPGVDPAPGPDLVFTGSTNLTTNNDFGANSRFGAITFDDSGTAAGNFALSGAAIDLGGDILVDTAAVSTQTISLEMRLTGDRSINVDGDTISGSTLILSGVISEDGTSRSLSVTDALANTTGGASFIQISGDNSFTGGFNLSENTVDALHNNALGSGTITITDNSESNGGDPILRVGDNIDLSEDIVISDTGKDKRLALVSGTTVEGEYSGGITVDEEDNGNFEISANSSGGNNSFDQILTISGSITSTSGAGANVNGDGVVRITGNNNISDTFELSNNGSKLRVGHNNALGGDNGATLLLDNSNTELLIEDGITTNAANNITIGTTGTGSKTIGLFDANNGTAESGTVAGDISILDTDAGTFDIEVLDAADTLTLSGAISNDVGATRIDVQGAGTKVFSGANTYDVETRLVGGILRADAADGVGTGALGNGGVIDFATGTLQYTANSAGTDYATRIQNSTSQIRLDTNSQTVTLAGIIDGTNTAGISKLGAGTLILSNAGNAYTGANRAVEGTLKLGAASALNEAGSLEVGGDEAGINATFDLAGFDQTVTSIVLGGNAATTAGLNNTIVDTGGGGTLTMGGGLTYHDGGANQNAMATISADIDLGGANRTFTIEDGSADVDLLISGDISISGTERLTKSGAGTLKLTGTNSNTRLTILDGVTQFEDDSNLGTGRIQLGSTTNGGTLEFVGSASDTVSLGMRQTSDASVNNTILANGTGSAAITFTNFADNGDGNTLTLGGANTGDNTISDDLGQWANNSLTKTGAGKWVLSTNQNYTGTTTVKDGTLQFGKLASLYNGNTANWNTGKLIVESGGTLAVNVGAGDEFTSGDLDTLIALGDGSGGFQGGSSIGIDTTNAAGGNFTYSSNIVDPNGGANSLGLTKLGSGSLTLTGNNTYTGTTTVKEGTLIVNGSLSNDLLVESGNTLSGTGSYGGTTTIEGIHSPGSSPGLENQTNLVYNDGSTFTWELINNTTSGPGTNFDRVQVSNNLTFNGTVNLVLDFNAATGSNVDWYDPFWGYNIHEWQIWGVGNSTTGFPTLSGGPGSWTDGTRSFQQAILDGELPQQAQLYLFQDGNSIYLRYEAALPEPTTFGLLGLVLAALTGLVRPKRRLGAN